MNPQRQHQYLNAMGITSWLPRATLPGAAPSKDWVHTFLYGHLDEEFGYADAPGEDIDHPISEAPVRPTSAVSGAARVQQGVKDALGSLADAAPAAKPAAKTPAEKAAEYSEEPVPDIGLTPRKDPTKAPNFRLSFYHFGQVLVVDSMPPQSPVGMSVSRQQQLCQNMIKAMGGSGALAVPHSSLPWPMLSGSRIDQGPVVASEAVRYKLDKLLSEHPVNLVLLLGESASQMVMQREEGLDTLRGMSFHYRSDIKVLMTHSLSEMLSIPECKKEVWKDLQPFVPLAS
jgi:hypothetical protein